MWVWPESTPDAWLESAAKQPALSQRVRDVDPGELHLLHLAKLLCES